MTGHPVRVTLQLSREAYSALDACSVREARTREEIINAAVLSYNRMSDPTAPVVERTSTAHIEHLQWRKGETP